MNCRQSDWSETNLAKDQTVLCNHPLHFIDHLSCSTCVHLHAHMHFILAFLSHVCVTRLHMITFVSIFSFEQREITSNTQRKGPKCGKLELSKTFKLAVMHSHVCIYHLCSTGLKGDSVNQLCTASIRFVIMYSQPYIIALQLSWAPVLV